MNPSASDRIYIQSKTGDVFFREECVGYLNLSERRVLRCLMDSNGENMSKETLIAVGWPGRVTVSNSLNMAIKKIRKISSSLGYENVIVTVSRIGFCLPDNSVFVFFDNEGGEGEIMSDFFPGSNKIENKSVLPAASFEFFFLLFLIELLLPFRSASLFYLCLFVLFFSFVSLLFFVKSMMV
ncbi:winged helix-turn-helix domain-containing protein [Enterobacter asburiae]|uniref:winged helix-turn-helix domain-containing protein n=1 Tax=Enterobacter asburiae TaxID=61645 RepID=UPI002A84148A|nr:helix-turn-helix domain-containing protein [Enterobacter asburiae]